MVHQDGGVLLLSTWLQWHQLQLPYWTQLDIIFQKNMWCVTQLGRMFFNYIQCWRFTIQPCILVVALYSTVHPEASARRYTVPATRVKLRSRNFEASQTGNRRQLGNSPSNQWQCSVVKGSNTKIWWVKVITVWSLQKNPVWISATRECQVVTF